MGAPAGIGARPAGAGVVAVPREVQLVGTSVRGRPIQATVLGDPAAARRVLVVGCIHGSERAGEAVTRALRAVEPAEGTAFWIVDAFNPDGCAAGTRGNARGVDLNRNQDWHWRHVDRPGGLFYSGTGPRSEPESRDIRALVRRIRPTVSVWYHQHAALVDRSGGNPLVEGCYARLVGLPYREFGAYPGSITSWQNDAFPHATAFVVELPGGVLPAASVARHVAALTAIAGRGAAACASTS